MIVISSKLRAVIEQYYPLLKAVDDKEFSSKPNPEKWSKKEELGHLIDSAQNNIQRFIRVQYEEQVHIMYHPDNWVMMNDYQHKETKDVIELWYLLNKQIISILEKIPADKYDALMCFSKDATIRHSVEFIAEDYVQHLTHHLESIVKDKEG